MKAVHPLLSELYRGVGHELNNVLATTQGYLQLLERSQEWSGKPASFMERTQDGMTRLGRLAELLNSLPKASSPVETLEVRLWLEENSPDFFPGQPSPQVNVPSPNGKALRISIFPRDLYAILRELCRNAMLAQGGEAALLTYVEDVENHRAVFQVDDVGQGISDEDLPRVMTPFFSRWKTQGGVGLGLTVVKTLVDLWEGDFQLLTSPQGGTRAQVSFKALQ